MRALLFLALLTAQPGWAETDVKADCAAAIAADPKAARNAAERWADLGGGVPARVCLAYAQHALGAVLNAALGLTALAEDPGVALAAGERALLLDDAAEWWLEAGQAPLARESFRAAIALDGETAWRTLGLAAAHLASDTPEGLAAAGQLLDGRTGDAPGLETLQAELAAIRRACGGAPPRPAACAAPRAEDQPAATPPPRPRPGDGAPRPRPRPRSDPAP